MRKNNPIVDTVYENIKLGVGQKILHLSSSNFQDKADGRQFVINDEEMLNFSSYSYLGLETNEHIINRGIDILQKYGSQFGCSRAYVSVDLYEKIEYMLSKIFEAPVIVAPSTTLAHQAALPVLVNDDDFVILDQQVHASIKTTVSMLKVRGIPVEILRHNRMDLLQERIEVLKRKYNRIWYLLDGVYSMYGDFAPLKKLEEIMNANDQFRVYVDDAHGMSWCGQNGRGYVLDEIKLHPQMYVVTSLNKAYAGAGGAMIFPDQDSYNKVRHCGGTLIFSTPVQPPMLGVNIGSAEIHLSNQLIGLQKDLKNKIAFCKQRIEQFGLPDLSNKDSPIFFIGTIFPNVSFTVVRKMMDKGYYVSSAIFPAVGMRKAGLRFCITVKLTYDDIDKMLKNLAMFFFETLEEENLSLKQIEKNFKIESSSSKTNDERSNQFLIKHPKLQILKYNSINDVSKEDWNEIFMYRGSFDWAGLAFIERVFKDQEDAVNNWNFQYVLVRNEDFKIVGATFFTEAIVKDDIFSPSTISKEIEIQRIHSPHYLCSRSVMMGSPITEGNHLFVDYDAHNWEEVAQILFKCASDLQASSHSNQIILRDFSSENIRFKEMLLSQGYVQINLPKANIISGKQLSWSSVDEYLMSISTNSKKKIKQQVIRFEKYYSVKIKQTATSKEVDQWYNLYLNVQKSSFDLSTFPVPRDFFVKAVFDSNWEVLELSIRKEFIDQKQDEVVAVGVVHKTDKTFSPMLLGLDYDYLHSHKNYRQAIFQLVKRANQLGVEKIYMGFTAEIEKRNFGAITESKVAFIMVNDQYNLDVLSNINDSVNPLKNGLQ